MTRLPLRAATPRPAPFPLSSRLISPLFPPLPPAAPLLPLSSRRRHPPACRRSATAMSRAGSSASSRMRQRVPPESGWSHLEVYPLGEETGLPLIPCPDCGLARVIERRSGKESTENYLRVFFKCPRNGYPKLCSFYEFQREYLRKLCDLGIVRMRTSPDLQIEGDDAADGGLKLEARKEAKNDAKVQAKLVAKMEDLMWKFNMILFVFAAVLGAVFMSVVGRMK